MTVTVTAAAADRAVPAAAPLRTRIMIIANSDIPGPTVTGKFKL